jgi:hypothetical protein
MLAHAGASPAVHCARLKTCIATINHINTLSPHDMGKAGIRSSKSIIAMLFSPSDLVGLRRKPC